MKKEGIIIGPLSWRGPSLPDQGYWVWANMLLCLQELPKMVLNFH